jgi:hypothetical protein
MEMFLSLFSRLLLYLLGKFMHRFMILLCLRWKKVEIYNYKVDGNYGKVFEVMMSYVITLWMLGVHIWGNTLVFSIEYDAQDSILTYLEKNFIVFHRI